MNDWRTGYHFNFREKSFWSISQELTWALHVNWPRKKGESIWMDLSVCILTTGTTGEAVVMVEATHSLAGLVGSIHCLVTLNTDSCNTTQNITSRKSNRRHTCNLYVFHSITVDQHTISMHTESHDNSRIQKKSERKLNHNQSLDFTVRLL